MSHITVRKRTRHRENGDVRRASGGRGPVQTINENTLKASPYNYQGGKVVVGEGVRKGKKRTGTGKRQSSGDGYGAIKVGQAYK